MERRLVKPEAISLRSSMVTGACVPPILTTCNLQAAVRYLSTVCGASATTGALSASSAEQTTMLMRRRKRLSAQWRANSGVRMTTTVLTSRHRASNADSNLILTSASTNTHVHTTHMSCVLTSSALTLSSSSSSSSVEDTAANVVQAIQVKL